MKVKTLSTICKLSNRISNPGSLTSIYRALEIGPNSVRCCSEFGNLHILLTEETGLKDPILVDCGSLQAITSSLPQDQEITLEEKPNKVNWSCGTAKGHLGTVQTDHKIPQITHQNFPWAPPADLANALLLASCACQAAAVSLGMYGITIEPDGDTLNMYSSNTISLAATKVQKGTFPGKKITVRPPVPGILSALLSSCPDCMLDVTDDGIFILGEWLMAHLPLGSALEHDLKSIADKYNTSKETAKINSSIVKKFITRARSLTDKKVSFNVSLKIQDGNLVLLHEGMSSSTEEWTLAEGLPAGTNYKSVTLPGDLLTLPLEFVQTICTDFLDKQELVLRGEQPEFTYVIGGS